MIRVIIDQASIEEAVLKNISSIGLKVDENVNVRLKAGRGDNGITAEIEIGEPTVAEAAPEAETVTEPEAEAEVQEKEPAKKTTRKKATTAKKAKVEEAVDTETESEPTPEAEAPQEAADEEKPTKSLFG